ncbi:T-cell surface glycoprotein CD3 gamma chain-like isoform X4 [Heptranchias perlo]|uniref:T-cell surface glycoprotein CD3 gamma chain-like isoform X4 n=1 Tax=Heptranchias perlo TaxID=212740 RepID=UPI0035594F40
MQHFKLLVIATSVIILLFGAVTADVEFDPINAGLKMKCDTGNLIVDGEETDRRSEIVTHFRVANFSCRFLDGKGSTVHVYLSMCKNCVPLDIGTVCGILIPSLISTIFIGIAVYSVSAQDKSRIPQASDRHPLMRNDVNEGVYSHLNNDTKSTYSELGKKRRR